jgi:hypothetical protein
MSIDRIVLLRVTFTPTTTPPATGTRDGQGPVCQAMVLFPG